MTIVAATSGKDGARLYAMPGYEAVAEHLAAIGFQAGRDELVRLPDQDGGTIAVIGLGESAKAVSAEALRYAAGSAVRQLAGTSAVIFALPLKDQAAVRAVLEGAALGGYSYQQYRTFSRKQEKNPVERVAVLSTVPLDQSIVEQVTVMAEAAALVKDLVNAPPSDLYPETFARAAQDAAADLPLELTVWDEAQLAADGFGAILGVGQGSTRGPRLVKVSYQPKGATKHLALVGKGITFDSGGLSLKPPAAMVGMKYDMAGAATVLGVTIAVARLGLPIRVTAWLCLAENMPSGSAIRPNDVLRIRGGRSVEVLNTDAEGRLVMADGLSAASEEAPDAIIDVATLTGASVVALGVRYSAVMGDDELVTAVVDAATSAGELLWPMPLPGELRSRLNSDVADIANATPGNTAAGMLLAGVFLQEFIGSTGSGSAQRRIPWAHIDIAGPARNSGSGYGFTGAGPTAVSLRALLTLAEEFSRK